MACLCFLRLLKKTPYLAHLKPNAMSELAQQLIAENKAKHARGEDASYLDLGKCGLA